MSRRDEELKKEGWTRQFVTEEPRLSEMATFIFSIAPL